MNTIQALLGVAMTAAAMGSAAESVSSATFQIEIEPGWVHRIEAAPAADLEWSELIRVHHPNGAGELSVRSYAAPGEVTPDRLRNLTNVPLATSLTLQRWGDYEGYQFDYVENASFYRQWWLVNERSVVFITYHCNAEHSDLETGSINRMVRSLTVATP